MKGRMQLDAIYNPEALIDVLRVMQKHNITDYCMSADLKLSETIPKKKFRCDDLKGGMSCEVCPDTKECSDFNTSKKGGRK